MLTLLPDVSHKTKRMPWNVSCARSALAAGRGGEIKDCREHDLLAVQSEAVCPREQEGDLFPQGLPLIKLGSLQQPLHGRSFTGDEL